MLASIRAQEWPELSSAPHEGRVPSGHERRVRVAAHHPALRHEHDVEHAAWELPREENREEGEEHEDLRDVGDDARREQVRDREQPGDEWPPAVHTVPGILDLELHRIVWHRLEREGRVLIG